MTETVIPAPAAVLLPVRGMSSLFPVRRIYCVGRNYAAHAVEMGHDPDREAPFFFQKNPDNLLHSGRAFPYPSRTTNLHHEVECFVALKAGGTDISVTQARDTIYGYGVAVDLTRRDIQDEAKAKNRPWEMAKAFENSAPISEVVPAEQCGHPENGRISLLRNGEVMQQGDLSQMIWKVPEIIAELSGYVSLAPGDIILTGTPSGVGPVERDDLVECAIDGLATLSFRVV